MSSYYFAITYYADYRVLPMFHLCCSWLHDSVAMMEEEEDMGDDKVRHLSYPFVDMRIERKLQRSQMNAMMKTFITQSDFHAENIAALERLLGSCGKNELQRRYEIQLSIIAEHDQILRYCHLDDWNPSVYDYRKRIRSQLFAAVRDYEALPQGNSLTSSSSDATSSCSNE